MPFRTNRAGELCWLTSESLCLPGLAHGFSTRTGGVSAAPWDSLNLGIARGDDDACVKENYRRFCAAIGTDAHRTVLSRQVHEDNVRLVTEADAGKGLWRQRDYTSVDAMICNTPNIPLVVFSADCGIILLYDPIRRAIGAVHAGWRGVAQGIVKKTVEKMAEAFGVWVEKKMYGRAYMGIQRTTFIIDEQGVIEQIFDKVDTKNHYQQILDWHNTK